MFCFVFIRISASSSAVNEKASHVMALKRGMSELKLSTILKMFIKASASGISSKLESASVDTGIFLFEIAFFILGPELLCSLRRIAMSPGFTGLCCIRS